tara:strand:+ start:1593 stop:1760 length:168 start_codon:yes stop_codon:yes gene_type:complete
METLIGITAMVAVICSIYLAFKLGVKAGKYVLKTNLNKLTVRQMLEHKRKNFRSL